MTARRRLGRLPRLAAGAAVGCALVVGAGAAAVAVPGPRGSFLELVPSRPPGVIEHLSPGDTSRWTVRVTLHDAPPPATLAVALDADGTDPALLDELYLTAGFCRHPTPGDGTACTTALEPLLAETTLASLTEPGPARATKLGVAADGLVVVDVRLDSSPARSAQGGVATVGVRVEAAGGADDRGGRTTFPRTGIATRVAAACAGALLGAGGVAVIASRRRAAVTAGRGGP